MDLLERLFGDAAERLLHDHIDEFLVTDVGVLIHSCGWSRDMEYGAPLNFRGAMLRHLRHDHQES